MGDRHVTGVDVIGNRLIMVIDDDESVRSALTDVLSREGYRVVAFADGDEGLAYLSADEPPALILLDMMLPTVEGWKFRTEQVMNPLLASIPVIVMNDATLDPSALLSKIREHCPIASHGPTFRYNSAAGR